MTLRALVNGRFVTLKFAVKKNYGTVEFSLHDEKMVEIVFSRDWLDEPLKQNSELRLQKLTAPLITIPS